MKRQEKVNFMCTQLIRKWKEPLLMSIPVGKDASQHPVELYTNADILQDRASF